MHGMRWSCPDGWCEGASTGGNSRGRQRAADVVAHRHEFTVHHRAAQSAGYRCRVEERRRRRPGGTGRRDARRAWRGRPRRLQRRAGSDRRRRDARRGGGGAWPTAARGRADHGADQARFSARGLQMPAINRRQAMVPAGARIVENPNGTAPGLWLEDGERLVLLLPGPPRELKGDAGIARGGTAGGTPVGAVTRQAVLGLRGEPSRTRRRLCEPLYRRVGTCADSDRETILASLGQIELHLSARVHASTRGGRCCAGSRVVRWQQLLGLDVFSRDGRSMEQVIGDLLVERGWRDRLCRVVHGRADHFASH